MKESNVAIFTSPESKLTIETVPIPSLKGGEILVRIEYTTLCRSDLYTYTGLRKEKSPTILGHEIVGRIAAFGAEAISVDLSNNQLAIGDRITWAIFASNPDSAYSKRGMPQKSDDLFKYGHEQITPTSHLHGGLSDYIILRKNTPIIKINEQVPLAVAALINCAVATVAGAMRIAGDINNKNVLICGAGMLGIVACAMAKSKGAEVINAIDTQYNRLEKSKLFGADNVCCIPNESNDLMSTFKQQTGKELSVDVVFDITGSSVVMEQSIDALSIGGTAIWIGATFPQKKTPIDGEKMVRKILTIKGLHNYNEQDLLAAVDFIETNYNKYPFEELVYQGFDLHSINEAFHLAVNSNHFRIGVKGK
jgi:putative phosphonate catabolism associated alcohol dehydrogenase